MEIAQINLLGQATEALFPGMHPEVAIEKFKVLFDLNGPYEMARRTNCLVNGSGEELAIAFMTFWNNNYHYGRY